MVMVQILLYHSPELLDSLKGQLGSVEQRSEVGAGPGDEQGGVGAGTVEAVEDDTDVVEDYSDYSEYETEDYSDVLSDYSNTDAEDVSYPVLDEDYDATNYDVVAEADVTFPDEEPVAVETTEATPVLAPEVDYAFDYAEEDNIEVETQSDLPLDDDALEEDEEEQEEVDVNIDEGFLEDSEGKKVELPVLETRSAVQAGPAGINTGGNTFIFFFCALGGTNHNVGYTLNDLARLD